MGSYWSQIVYKETRQLIIAKNILCTTALMELQPKMDLYYFIADHKQIVSHTSGFLKDHPVEGRQ